MLFALQQNTEVSSTNFEVPDVVAEFEKNLGTVLTSLESMKEKTKVGTDRLSTLFNGAVSGVLGEGKRPGTTPRGGSAAQAELLRLRKALAAASSNVMDLTQRLDDTSKKLTDYEGGMEGPSFLTAVSFLCTVFTISSEISQQTKTIADLRNEVAMFHSMRDTLQNVRRWRWYPWVD